MRKQYDNQLKLIYNLGIEKMLIGEEFRKKIPKSTASTWRSLNVNSIVNSEYSEDVRKIIFNLLEFKTEMIKREKRMLFILRRFKQLLVESMGEKKYQKMLKNNRTKLIRIISRNPIYIDQNLVLKLLNIKPKTYKRWKSEIKHFCTSSPFHICARSKPQQLTVYEVETLKKILIAPDKIHWSISSVHGDAFRKGVVGVSRATVYRYNKYFQFRVKQAKGRKPPYRPLRATMPNEIWHADISVFKTEDGKKHYIYAVIDNFSRKILSWTISNKSSGYLSMCVLRKALYGCNITKLHYVTDGGTENNNLTIKEFLSKHHASINHSIALRDIVQSNSMIESVFRTMKSNYLYLRKSKTKNQLLKVMRSFVYEYNEIKPHYSQMYYTPSEIYAGLTNSVDASFIYQRAFLNRYYANKLCDCTECICEPDADQKCAKGSDLRTNT